MRRGAWIGVCFLVLIGSAHAQSESAPSSGVAGLSAAETRELLEAMKATAKATRENVDYARSVPDILFQILAKLDKIEGKLDKIENATKRGNSRRSGRYVAP
jgi:hypothetical protein